MISPLIPDVGAVVTRLPGALCLLSAWLTVSTCASGDAEHAPRQAVRAAVAANFAVPHQELARRFEAATGIAVETSLGSTGQLYAQIQNGAPFDVFLAADVERPHLLEQAQLAVAGTRFTYAVGRLALYAPQWDSVRSGAAALGTKAFQHLAIADPRTAPYGAAAKEVLERWNVWDSLQTSLVRGANVGQVFQFVESGAAEVGFVALSQVVGSEPRHYWVVPQELHRPIHQDAVLLQPGARNSAAQRFLAFLQSDQGRHVMTTFGYSQP
jgi:molybdate transport system substrate-binding protein